MRPLDGAGPSCVSNRTGCPGSDASLAPRHGHNELSVRDFTLGDGSGAVIALEGKVVAPARSNPKGSRTAKAGL